VVFTANHLTDTDKQNSTGKYTQKANNAKYSQMKQYWFSCLLQHLARRHGGLILQRSQDDTGITGTIL